MLWIAVAGLLFGSQFIPSKYCIGFRPGAYNLSMGLGIMAGSLAGVLALGFSGMAPQMAVLAFAGGITWVAGNYLLIVAVARAGMARSFIVINFTAVLSFLGGVLFLGELPDVSAPRLLLMAGAVGLVLLGSFLVTTTAPKDERPPAEAGRLPPAEKAGHRLRGVGPTARGLLAAFIATLFFSAYNVMIAFIVNRAGTPAGTTFLSLAPGIVIGALLVALLAGRNDLGEWREAPRRWHLLAISQGLVWAAAMVCIMFGWMGTGIAMGTPVQVGTQTLVSSLWGILAFGEFRGLEDRGSAYSKFAAGAILTVSGIVVMALI